MMLQVHDIRPDSGGGCWCRVIVHLDEQKSVHSGETVDLTIHLERTAQKSLREVEDLAKRRARVVLGSIRWEEPE